LDEKGEAEVRKIEAETGQILIDDGTISPEEERKRVASDPGSGYETIDVLDVPDLEEEEIEGLEPKASAERLAQAGETGETGDDAALAA